MSVRWPDGSLTGSVHVVETASAPVAEPEPENTPDKGSTKEVKDGAR